MRLEKVTDGKWMMKTLPLLLTLLYIVGAGCSTSYVGMTPETIEGEKTVYKEGYKVAVYENSRIKVGSCTNKKVFEEGQHLQVFFAIQNKGSGPITVSSGDVTARIGKQTLTVFTGDEIRKQLIEKRNSAEFWSDVATGLAVVGAVAGGIRAASGSGGTASIVTSAVVANDADSEDYQSKQALKAGVKELNGYLRTTVEPGKWGSGYAEINCPDNVDDEKKSIHIVLNAGGEKVVFQYTIAEI
jgi:hypothetical protein